MANGIDPAAAEKIYDEIYAFANLRLQQGPRRFLCGGGLSDGVLQMPLPREYMAALLTSVLDNSDKVSGYIGECRECGIALLPPDINRSADRFTVEEGGIRFGLVAIKNIGRGFIQAVMRERETGATLRPFTILQPHERQRNEQAGGGKPDPLRCLRLHGAPDVPSLSRFMSR